MSVVLTPNKTILIANLTYIEEIGSHGNSKFHFIRSKADREQWQTKGYRFIGEPGFIPGKQFHRLQTQWKRLTWKEHNHLYSSCLIHQVAPNGSVVSKLDTLKYRQMKLETCLKKWDLKDEQGEIIPLQESLSNLHPDVAKELLDLFEEVAEPSEKALEKLKDVSERWLKGEAIPGENPEIRYLYEHLIASHYHWGLETIRNMEFYDFQAHLHICIVREKIEREFKARLAGADVEDKKKPPSVEEFMQKAQKTGGGTYRKNLMKF